MLSVHLTLTSHVHFLSIFEIFNMEKQVLSDYVNRFQKRENNKEGESDLGKYSKEEENGGSKVTKPK